MSSGGTRAAGERQPTGRRWGRAILRGCAIVLISLVACEIALQAASLVARAVVSRGSLEEAGGAVTILCLGDSHTYGLPLPAEDSYPAQLERALAEEYPGTAFQVVNLGIPGLNSAFVANRLERQIHQLRPDLVIIWIGVNNRWNVIEGSAWVDDDRGAAIRRALMASRLFRLASIAWYTQTGYQYDPDDHGGFFEGERPPSGVSQDPRSRDLANIGLARDLRRMAETSRALGVPVLFVSYPLQRDSELNRTIRATGRELRVAVIDSARARDDAMDAGHALTELIDETRGAHPSALLYRYVVEAMLPVVEAILVERLPAAAAP